MGKSEPVAGDCCNKRVMDERISEKIRMKRKKINEMRNQSPKRRGRGGSSKSW
jgi:hypothetical protein